MAAPTMLFTEDPALQLDDLLYEICEELQLSTSRYKLAQERYKALTTVLESEKSPFRLHRPLIYPQGSMRLGTTVHPRDGVFDLDFVLQLSRSYRDLNPMTLLFTLFNFLKEHGTYSEMLELKKRCVRLKYADLFNMDVLPGCINPHGGSDCIKVPDRETRDWTDSNPVGYAKWFEKRAQLGFLKVLMARALPIPAQESAEQKRPLQLIVQLLKRWRDIYYQKREASAAISIVLTTLAGKHYDGDECINTGLAKILDGIVSEIFAAERAGARLTVLNPANQDEDLSERWDKNAEAYGSFKQGIFDFRREWNSVLEKNTDVTAQLERLFGESVKPAIVKQAKRVQELRSKRALGTKSSGVIASAAAVGSIAMRPNTFHGEE